ncbi:MAG: extracellular solute-binding protein [Syntrophothermus sp.]
MKKAFSPVLILGLFLSLLAGFMSPALAEEQVTLTFWTAYNTESPENKMLTETLIPKFEAANPGIKVQAVAFPYDELRRKLLTSVAGGTTPDLVRSDIIWVPEFANMGVLLRLDNKFADFKALAAKTFPGPLSTNYWKGGYYGLPLDTNTRVLMWNKELFDKAGLKKAPATFQDFLEAVAKLSKDTNGDGKNDVFGYAEGGTGGWNLLPWFWSNGGEITDKEITRASGYLNSKANVETLTMLVNMYKKGQMAPSIMGSGLSTGDGFAKDKYAMFVDGPWMFPIFQGQYPDKKIYTALIPAGKGGKSISVTGGEDIVIFKATKNPEAAWKFVKFMLSEEAQLKMAETGQMPVLSTLMESSYIKTHPYYGIFLEQLKTARARTPHPAWTRIDEQFSTAVKLALSGSKTPKQALDDAAKAIDGLLK